MAQIKTFPTTQLSVPPSTFCIPDDFWLRGAFDNIKAEALVGVFIVLTQEHSHNTDQDKWVGLPLYELWQRIMGIPKHQRASWASGDDLELFCYDGLVWLDHEGFITMPRIGAGNESLEVIRPIEKLIQPLGNFRCP